MSIPRFALVAVALAGCTNVEAQELTGRASIIDGDTIEIAGERIRIWGVDAPESGQTCVRGGQEWRCGQQSALALSDWIGPRPVACMEQERDRYDRSVANCSVDSQDVGEWLVREGWAIEYTQYSDGRYQEAERAAAAAGVGVHAGSFTPPWEWRRQQRSAPAPQTAPSSDCQIKGNVSRDGDRIYHLPGMRSYANTRINEADGERWFCSEEEAVRAGWRAPRG